MFGQYKQAPMAAEDIVYGDIPVTDTERRRIENQNLRPDDVRELSAFYVPITEQEREETYESPSAANISKMRVKAFQALKKTYVWKTASEGISDWFQNVVPKNINDWPKKHSMAMELEACIKPIINSDMRVECSFLLRNLQERGAFAQDASPSSSYGMWSIRVFLDSRFYANIQIYTPEGVPTVVTRMYEAAQAKNISVDLFNGDVFDPKDRGTLIQKKKDDVVNKGVMTEEEERQEEEEERLEQEEIDAKNIQLDLEGASGWIKSFELNVIPFN